MSKIYSDYISKAVLLIVLILSVWASVNSAQFYPSSDKILNSIEEEVKNQGIEVKRASNAYSIERDDEKALMMLTEKGCIGQFYRETEFFSIIHQQFSDDFESLHSVFTDVPKNSYESLPDKLEKLLADFINAVKIAEQKLAQKQNLPTIDYTLLYLVSCLMILLALFYKGENKTDFYLASIAAALMAFSVYFAHTHSFFVADFALSRLEMARDNLVSAFLIDHRHPFLYMWILKLSDYIFPQPEALFLTGLFATVASAFVMAYAVAKILKNPALGFLAAIVIVCSPAYLFYAVEPHSFAYFFLESIAIVYLVSQNKFKSALVVAVIAAYTSFVMLLFFPALYYLHLRKAGKFPNIYWSFAFVPAFYMAVRGTIIARKVVTDHVSHWGSDSMLNTFVEGLYHISPGGIYEVPVILLIVSIVYLIINFSLKNLIFIFLIVFPPLFLLSITDFIRIKPQYFSAFMPLLLLCGIIVLNKLDLHRFVTIAALIFLTCATLYNFNRQPPQCQHVATDATVHVSKKVADEQNLWMSSDQLCRMFSYYTDPDAFGRNNCKFPDFECNNKKCNWVLEESAPANASPFRKVDDVIQYWQESKESFTLVYFSGDRINTEMVSFAEKFCKTIWFDREFVIYHCN